MKISIIIPVYHCIDYIEDCLNSVVEQTYQGEVECILVDDCGGDESIDIAEHFIDECKSSIDFHIVKHERNRGASAARNTGLRYAKGDYLFFLDSDDMIMPTCIAEMVDMLGKYPNADIIHTGIKTTDGSIPWFDFEKNPFPEYTDDVYEIKVNLLGREVLPATPWAKLIRRELLIENNITFYEGIVIEDVLWCNILAKYVKSIVCINHSTYIYRIHEGSVVTSGMGVDPMRKLVVYDLMIDAIDEPYMTEQTIHIEEQVDKVYFSCQDRFVRRKASKLYKKLLVYGKHNMKCKLRVKSLLGLYDKGNSSFAYYLFYQACISRNINDFMSSIFKRLIHF